MPCSPNSLRRHRGFSLVELMVGIVVAMAAVVVVMQIFKVSEGQRRNTTGGDDAQTNGAVALSLLQRDLRQAGQGFTNGQLLDCQLRLGNGRSIAELVPVFINQANIPDGDDNTDTLLISYGSGWGSPEGQHIISQTAAATYSVGAPKAFQLGDRVIAAPEVRATPCALDLTSMAAAPVDGSSYVSVVLGLNNAANGFLFDLGRAPRFVAYAVRSGRLTACDFLTQDCTNAAPDNWTEIADNIVSMRAEYAVDTSPNRDVTVDAYSQSPPPVKPSPVCNWSRVIGVRLVLVARSRQPETADVAAAAPTWAGGASTPITINGDDWKRYRYKTFETTVPLRNVPDASDESFKPC